MLPGIRQGFDCLAAAVQGTRRAAAALERWLLAEAACAAPHR
ncbi:hypothetical protein [Thauera sp. SDU_THAU2]